MAVIAGQVTRPTTAAVDRDAVPRMLRNMEVVAATRGGGPSSSASSRSTSPIVRRRNDSLRVGAV